MRKKANQRKPLKIAYAAMLDLLRSNREVYLQLKNACKEVTVIDPWKSGFKPGFRFSALAGLLRTFLKNPVNFRNYYLKNPGSFKEMTKICTRILEKTEPDAILQKQTLFRIDTLKISCPYFIYTDFTMKLAIREYPLWAPFVDKNEMERYLELESAAYKSTKMIFTYCDHTRASLIKDYGIAPQKVKTVGLGYNFSSFPDISNKKYGPKFLFVGNDSRRKGYSTLTKAFEVARKKNSSLELTVVGRVKDQKQAGVTFLNEVNHEKMSEIFDQHSVLVVPSLCDPLPNVIIEAFGRGLPVIATTVDGIPEVVKPNLTGALFNPNDCKTLSSLLLHYAKNTMLMKRQGRNCQKLVRNNYQWSIVVNKILEHLPK